MHGNVEKSPSLSVFVCPFVCLSVYLYIYLAPWLHTHRFGKATFQSPRATNIGKRPRFATFYMHFDIIFSCALSLSLSLFLSFPTSLLPLSLLRLFPPLLLHLSILSEDFYISSDKSEIPKLKVEVALFSDKLISEMLMTRNSPDGLSRYARFDETTFWDLNQSIIHAHSLHLKVHFSLRFFDLHLGVSMIFTGPSVESVERLSDAMAKYHLEISTRRSR